MKLIDFKNSPQVCLYILVMFLFYLSAVQHPDVLVIWLVVISLVILVFSRDRKRNFKSILGVMPFIIMVLIPFFIRGFRWPSIEQKYFSYKLILRLMCAIMTVSFISAQFSYLYLVEGVMKMGLPNFLNQIISLTFRYFFMIRYDVDKTSKAMKARCFDNAKTFTKIASQGEMIGGFFLKAADHGDKVYNAMKSRGFTTESKFNLKKMNSTKNIIFLIFIGLFFITLLILERALELPWLL